MKYIKIIATIITINRIILINFVIIVSIITFFYLRNDKAYCEGYCIYRISPYAKLIYACFAFYLFILGIIFIFEKFKIFYSVYYFFCITGIYLLCDIGVFIKLKSINRNIKNEKPISEFFRELRKTIDRIQKEDKQ